MEYSNGDSYDGNWFKNTVSTIFNLTLFSSSLRSDISSLLTFWFEVHWSLHQILFRERIIPRLAFGIVKMFYGIFIGNMDPSKHFRAQYNFRKTVTPHSDLLLNSVRATIIGLGFREGLVSIASHKSIEDVWRFINYQKCF